MIYGRGCGNRSNPDLGLKRQGRGVDKPRGLTPRCNGTFIKQGDLVAPALPTLLGLSGKQFEVRASHQTFDPVPYAVRLATVLTALFHYQPADILGAANGLAACRQKTLLGIGARPIAEAREEVGSCFAALFSLTQ